MTAAQGTPPSSSPSAPRAVIGPDGTELTGKAPGRRPLREVVGGYLALTKPRIIELLLVTTLPVMFLAEGGFPSAGLMLATLIGGYLAAGGANALNMYLERDIDAKMKRTKNRPLVTGMISPRNGLIFGVALAIISVIWLGLLVNWVSAALAAGAILLYVVFYTMILKRRTSQNIVWGGIAGCMPVLIGWASVTGTVSWTAFFLFLVVFFWTPPHYWPLAEKFSRDYANAGVPMLPVVATRRTVANQMLVYTAAMIASSFAIIPFGHTGIVYLVGAIVAALYFGYLVIRYTVRTYQGKSGRALQPMSVFHGSIFYLTILFVALAIDPFVQL